MGYRRKPEATETLRQHQSICQAHMHLIERSGVPLLVFEDYEVFLYFLEHGSTLPRTEVQFNIDEIKTDQRQTFLLFLQLYLQVDASVLKSVALSLTLEERQQLAKSSQHA